MSPREIGWRASRAVREALHRGEGAEQTARTMPEFANGDSDVLLQRFRAGIGRPVLLSLEHVDSIRAQRPSDVRAVIAEADLIVAGQRTYFGYPAADVGAVPDWNFDPVGCQHWPAMPSKKIDHRTAS